MTKQKTLEGVIVDSRHKNENVETKVINLGSPEKPIILGDVTEQDEKIQFLQEQIIKLQKQVKELYTQHSNLLSNYRELVIACSEMVVAESNSDISQ